jgi:hypothetical protein
MRHIFKTTILAALSILCWLNVSAQEESIEPAPKKNWKWPFHAEFGLNASGLVQLALSPGFADSANVALVNPYMLNARFSMGDVGIHGAIGGRYRQSVDAIEGFRDSETRTNQQIEWRAGIDYRAKIGTRFAATFGADYARSYRLSEVINDSGFDVIERIQQTALNGAGISLNLSYWITPRFGIMTESNYFWMIGTVDNARRFKNFPELDDSLVQQEFTELRTMLPANLFLVFKF